MFLARCIVLGLSLEMELGGAGRLVGAAYSILLGTRPVAAPQTTREVKISRMVRIWVAWLAGSPPGRPGRCGPNGGGRRVRVGGANPEKAGARRVEALQEGPKFSRIRSLSRLIFFIFSRGGSSRGIVCVRASLGSFCASAGGLQAARVKPRCAPLSRPGVGGSKMSGQTRSLVVPTSLLPCCVLSWVLYCSVNVC